MNKHYIRTMESSNLQTPFTLTPAAIARIAHLLSDEPAGAVFRVRVDGGGCSGFQYHFEFSPPPLAEDDHLIESGTARVAIDSASLELLKNSILDYEQDLMSAGFAIKNPNATANCGCGNSFSVTM